MSSYLPSIVTGTIGQGADLLRSTIGSVSWGPSVSISKAAVTSLFTRIEIGTLIIEDQTTNKTSIYGQKIAKEYSRSKLTNGHGVKKAGKVGKVQLVVKKETFWVRLALFADMGFVEAYMLGEVECEDLTGFFLVRNSPIPSSINILTKTC